MSFWLEMVTAMGAQSVTKMGHWVLSVLYLLSTSTSPSHRDPGSYWLKWVAATGILLACIA